MFDRMSHFPRIYYVILLVLSVAMLINSAVLYFRLGMNDTRVESLPYEYWLVLAMMLFATYGLMLSAHCLKFSPYSLWVSFVGLGIACLVPFLLEVGRHGWTGNSIASAIGAGVFFALALTFRLLERRSGPTSLTNPNGPETA